MKKLLIYNLLFLITANLSAQDIVVEAEYPRTVRAGEQFAIQWRINARGGDFTAPSFAGFIRLMGPQTSYSSSTQIINGRVTHETSESYLFYLQAVDEGIFVLPPASVTIKNKTYHSDSVRIVVTGGSAPPAAGQPGTAGQQGAAGQQQRTSPSSPPEGEISLDLSVNRREVYMGEPVSVTVKLYTRVDISGYNEIKYPSFTGFLKTDLETPPLSSLRQENINGTIYGTGVLQQFLLYP
ncbi:MAG TPA: BatD family protein, partial [Bacteroidales bacterium]|nr:BatD family protein [Bacteroidales bacterium]